MAKQLEVKEVKVSDEFSEITANIVLIEEGNGGNVKVRRPQPGSPAARQLAHFAKQDKVRYRLPKSADELPGSFESPQVNDLMITVNKGVSVNLPEDIAKILDDSQNISDTARSSASLKEVPTQLQS